MHSKDMLTLVTCAIYADFRACHCRYEILTRTADGNEGGRHQLLTAAVGNGNLYVCKVQIGDKRWFKGESARLAPLLAIRMHYSAPL